MATEFNPPDSIRTLLTEIVNAFSETLQGNLVGIYLHGSLAMGGFNPLSSDIDFLVVVQDKLSTQTKKRIVEQLLALSQSAPAKGLEMSIVTLQTTRHFTYPTPHELHFSNAWKEAFENGEIDFNKENKDPDLAAHFLITSQRGVCLAGEPISRVFTEVPPIYYWQSILADAQDIIEDITNDPVYGILNLCRVMAFQRNSAVTSKVEGGKWALSNLPAAYHPLISQALSEYAQQLKQPTNWDKAELNRFASFAKTELAEGYSAFPKSTL